jgi:hypothetical protein
MVTHSDLTALIQQAARNLDSLERLLEASGASATPLDDLRARLVRLKHAYTRETNEFTRRVLEAAIERRSGVDRRRSRPELESA